MKTKTTVFAILISVSMFWGCNNSGKQQQTEVKISYPVQKTVFPLEIPAPKFIWQTNNPEIKNWLVSFSVKDEQNIQKSLVAGLNTWTPDKSGWEKLKSISKQGLVTFKVLAYGKAKSVIAADSISFTFSADSVGAPIIFRSVPLPFKFARENLAKVSWHLGNVGSSEQPPAMLSNLPVCGNCHSVSSDGKTLAMDVDARDEKGAYAIVKVGEKAIMSEKEIINWSDFVNGEFTYGLLSQISPDSRYVVSTLKDCEIFVDRNNMEYSQLFFPFKGILGVYDRFQKKYFELEGANDTNYVHSNPCWSPDGKYIYFTKSKAAHIHESGVFRGSKAVNFKVYNQFLNNFLERKTLFKFDIYRVPFNDGKGGKAESVAGASENGMSNYFPKFTSDGKWMVFCQAESFMLLMPDSKLYIQPVSGGQPRLMNCNTKNMNSWHSFSPNGKWMVFSSKANGPFTQLYLTHIDENGDDSPPVLLEHFVFDQKAANIPEFINIKPTNKFEIVPEFLEDDAFTLRIGELKSKEKQYKESIVSFDKAIRLNAKNHRAWHGKAHALMMTRQPDEAIRHFSKAVELDPSNSNYFVSRGGAFLTLNQTSKALDDYNTAVRLDPLNFMAYNNRGMLYRKNNEQSKALADFEKSIELNPESNGTYVNRGVVKAQMGKHNEAMADFEKSLQLNPEDVSAYYGKAIVYQESGQMNLALDEYAKAISMAPNNPETYFNRALLLMKSGNKNTAMEDMRRAADMNYAPAIKLLQNQN